MKKISEFEGAAVARAIQEMAAGRLVIVTTADGVRVQVTRLAIVCETVNGLVNDFERFDAFDTIAEAKGFLKGEPSDNFKTAA